MDTRSTAMIAEHLTEALDRSERFHRDTGFGRIFHPGTVSFREISTTDSLHVVVDGRRVSAHVDRISPLRCRTDGSTCYAWNRVVAHNVTWMGADLARLLRRHPNRRATVDLEVVPADQDPSAPSDPDDVEATRRLAERYLSELNLLVERRPATPAS